MNAIRLAGSVAEHDLLMSAADHTQKLIQAICSHSQIVGELECEETKATVIVNNVNGLFI